VSTAALWTLDELVRRVSAALAGSAYLGAPNRRVRDVPDRRAVRWYITIGLVDRPAAMAGRTALYGPRHLLQIVAVKRRQAAGHSLAEIQAELAGATDETLRRVAAVPDELLGADPATTADDAAAQAPRPAPRARFWADRPAADGAASDTGGVRADSVSTLAAVQLGGGALIVLPRQPGPDDVRAIHAAARPLLDLLADLGLLIPGEWSDYDV
jgi:DNA-binding transcriptional MerR regulator